MITVSQLKLASRLAIFLESGPIGNSIDISQVALLFVSQLYMVNNYTIKCCYLTTTRSIKYRFHVVIHDITYWKDQVHMQSIKITSQHGQDGPFNGKMENWPLDGKLALSRGMDYSFIFCNQTIVHSV